HENRRHRMSRRNSHCLANLAYRVAVSRQLLWKATVTRETASSIVPPAPLRQGPRSGPAFPTAGAAEPGGAGRRDGGDAQTVVPANARDPRIADRAVVNRRPVPAEHGRRPPGGRWV